MFEVPKNATFSVLKFFEKKIKKRLKPINTRIKFLQKCSL